MNVEIITTENSRLKETGFGDHLSCRSVMKSVELTHSVRLTVCNSVVDLNDVLKRKPDFVILAAKYMPISEGNDIWFSDFFESNNIIFSGSNRETLKFDSDKILAKNHLHSVGIKTARHFTAYPGQFTCEGDFPFTFPLFLKPVDAANGNGVDDLSLVNSFIEFEAKVISLFEIYNLPVLVEEYLNGKEYTVAIIKKNNGELIISPIEVLPPESKDGLRILGAEVKKFDTESLIAIGFDDISKVSDLAEAAFGALGVRGFGRIDVKMDSDGECFFMEANLVPGMNCSSSYFPQACEIANDLSFDDVIRLIFDECLERVITQKNEWHKQFFKVPLTAGAYTKL